MKKFKIDEIVLVFIVAMIALAASILEKQSRPEIEANKIKEELLDSHRISLVKDVAIDDSRLRQVSGMSYDSLKASLKAKNDFCVYIEDEKGNIILAKGSDKLSEEGIACQ